MGVVVGPPRGRVVCGAAVLCASLPRRLDEINDALGVRLAGAWVTWTWTWPRLATADASSSS